VGEKRVICIIEAEAETGAYEKELAERGGGAKKGGGTTRRHEGQNWKKLLQKEWKPRRVGVGVPACEKPRLRSVKLLSPVWSSECGRAPKVVRSGKTRRRMRWDQTGSARQPFKSWTLNNDACRKQSFPGGPKGGIIIISFGRGGKIPTVQTRARGGNSIPAASGAL